MVGVNGSVFTEEDPTIILFDEGHGQFFNRTLYNQAITDIEDLGMKVVFNTQEFNASTLEGIDILIITDPQESITFRERNYIRDYLLEEKSMLLLANPLVETNATLDGHGDYLNYILNEQEFGILARFWTQIDSVDLRKPTDVVKNDFSNAGKPEYLILDINTTDHEIFSESENVSTVITSSCSIQDAREELIVGSTEAYADPPSGDPHSFSTNIGLFVLAGRAENFDVRVAMGGSSIMFSDIEDSYLGSSWYEAEDNAKLWRNTIKWLSAEIQEENIPKPKDDLYIPFLLGITALAIIFVVGGIFLFMIGSGQQVNVSKVKVITKEEVTKEKGPKKSDDETKTGTSKHTKRDRRLQQIKKHSKSDRRK
ncbi:MAG: hypothetical protein ACW98I_15540 [Candidatus Hodarchaeales archaeon]|jgi:hypothetical protein